MLSKPKYGWTHFALNGFECSPSCYLSDVPFHLLDCITSWIESGVGACYLDCEGKEYTILFNPDHIYVIDDNGDADNSLLDITPPEFYNREYKNLAAKELIEDIESNIKSWKWAPAFIVAQQDADNYELELKLKIEVLRSHLPLEYQSTKENNYDTTD